MYRGVCLGRGGGTGGIAIPLIRVQQLPSSERFADAHCRHLATNRDNQEDYRQIYTTLSKIPSLAILPLPPPTLH